MRALSIHDLTQVPMAAIEIVAQLLMRVELRKLLSLGGSRPANTEQDVNVRRRVHGSTPSPLRRLSSPIVLRSDY